MNHEQNSARAMLDLMQTNWPEASAAQAGTAISILRLGRLLQRTALEGLQGADLTFTEFELLCALRIHSPPHRLTPSELYAAMLISSGGLTKILKGLEARGLVRRISDAADGRSRPVELTRDGRDLIETAMISVQSAERPIITRMKDGWRCEEALVDALARLTEAAEHEPQTTHTDHPSKTQT